MTHSEPVSLELVLHVLHPNNPYFKDATPASAPALSNTPAFTEEKVKEEVKQLEPERDPITGRPIDALSPTPQDK